jgi:hypothetical protein
MDKSRLYRPIFESAEFARYRDELAAWLAAGGDEAALHAAEGEMRRVIRAGAIPPEHLLASLHAAAFTGSDGTTSMSATLQMPRYIDAVSRLMHACFGRSAQLRVIQGNDARVWSVMPIAEGARWDPEIEMRRRGWLCCVTAGDRRYISPVPRDWDQWTESEIAGAIGSARPDQRGG